MNDERTQQIWQQLRERVMQRNENKRKPNTAQVAQMKQQLAHAHTEPATHARKRPPQRS
jgi:hypothetical protein